MKYWLSAVLGALGWDLLMGGPVFKFIKAQIWNDSNYTGPEWNRDVDRESMREANRP